MRLDALEILDQHHLVRHALRGKGEAHRHGGQEALRDVGDDDANHEDEVGDKVLAEDRANGEEGEAEENGDGGHDLDEVLELARDRGLNVLGLQGERRNAAHHGLVPDVDHDGARRARRYEGAEKA